MPFGSVQLSPDTDQQPHNINGVYNKDTYKYCAGYQYDDKEIVGFSHTHFSGTGHSDLGDFLVMPTVGPLQMEPGKKNDPNSGFRSAFSHANETAEAGYYKVLLEDHNIWAEMTATTRVGFHQFTFPASADSHIILDLMATEPKTSALAAQLDSSQFAQVHRSVVVNLKSISHVTRGANETADIHLKGRGEVLPVSRSYLHLFRQM